jgi:hypothetical protein
LVEGEESIETGKEDWRLIEGIEERLDWEDLRVGVEEIGRE